ncbi:MAG: PSD1 and planctomycete cytochrome C domain-containing protein [Pirellula sp.]|nr:PSD1 and planctomycete cytochrome C domain-containing protein [Pirellula sp.]
MHMESKWGFLRSWLLATILLLPSANAYEENAYDENPDLDRQATSLLRRECFSCHGPDKQEANLRLDSLRFLWSGGDNGPVLEKAENTDELSLGSILLARVEHEDGDLVMPPKRPLNASELAVLKAWVKSGAKWPPDVPAMQADGQPVAELGDAWSDSKNPIRVLFGGNRLDLWSLRRIQRPVVPDVVDVQWCRNPIDRFVLADWEAKQLAPAPVASDQALVRRVFLDVIGLPPTFEQVQAYMHDTSPDKYDRLLEERMLSPEFGVHWARTWLDVVRYSDSNGFDWDEFRPNAWRYRDYVVRALNRDMPYDQFIEQQLAGDELLDGPPKNIEEQDSLIATGYLRLGPQDNAAALFNEQDRARAELLSDLTETTANAMLGLTMSCCRCHDHKTDPLSHADHYRMRAFFAASQHADKVPVDLIDEQQSIGQHNKLIDESIQRSNEMIATIVNAVIARQPEKIDEKQAKECMTPEERESVAMEKSKIESLKQTRRSFTQGLLMQDNPNALQPIFVLAGGDHRTPKEPVEPGFPSVLFPNPPILAKPKNPSSTGRRLTLARWIVSPDNPWAARVLVNRIWQSYFGQGIVETPNDLGVTGSPPTHPELLDYLASELIDSGWSLKHIHRLITGSSTYRQQSIAKETSSEQDPRATLHIHLRRMSAEQLRDSILKVSGLLQERAGGPPVWPVLDEQTLAANPAVLDDNETKTKGWYPSPESDQTVRSLYLIQKRTIRIPWLETFDLPENMVSCGRRESSIVAPQSLALMNGSLTLQAAERMAATIQNESTEVERQVTQGFRDILQRDPREEELDSCKAFLATRTLVELCLVLLNTNEFGFIE